MSRVRGQRTEDRRSHKAAWYSSRHPLSWCGPPSVSRQWWRHDVVQQRQRPAEKNWQISALSHLVSINTLHDALLSLFVVSTAENKLK